MVSVFAADIPDADGAAVLLAAVAACFPRIRQLWADGAFLGWFVDWCQQVLGWLVTIPSRPPDQRGWVVLPRRRVAERSLAWLSRPRRLAKDYEELPEAVAALASLGQVGQPVDVHGGVARQLLTEIEERRLAAELALAQKR